MAVSGRKVDEILCEPCSDNGHVVPSANSQIEILKDTESQTSDTSDSSSTIRSASDTTNIQPYIFKPRKVSKVSEITVKSSSFSLWGLPSCFRSCLTDKETPWITGIALLPDDQLVLVDYRNAMVKLVNTKQNKIVTKLKLSSNPWDITAVNNNVVAITMPEENAIQLVSVSNSSLSQGQTVKVKGQCRGIVHNNGKFIVTYFKPAKIEIILISSNSNVLKVIDKGPNGESLFVDPQYIAISPDYTHVYISDYDKRAVTCMTLDGKVKGVYKDECVRCPRGLTVDKSGSVYVVCGDWICYIYQISGDCSQGQILPGSTLEKWPESMTYCNKEDKLYVGYENRLYNIKVFQFK